MAKVTLMGGPRKRKGERSGDGVVAAAEERRRVNELSDEEYAAHVAGQAELRKRRSRREERARKRPAERAGAAGGGVVGVAYLLGLRDPEWLAALGVVSSWLPVVVTGLIAQGGIRGVLRVIVGK